MGKLEGTVAVLTGAGAGIGRAVVERYVEEGARVVAVDVDEAGVTALAAQHPDAVIALVADVATWEGNTAAVEAATATFGRLDLFVANAGITDAGRPLEDVPGADLSRAFTELFSVNVLAPFLGVRAAMDDLARARGAVIITGSYAGSHASGGGALYTASKHAVLGVVRQLAYELAPDIRVNGVAPGVAPTRLKGISALGQNAADSVFPGTAAILPLHEVPTVDAYGGIFTLLASTEDSGVMTGTMVDVDSGLGVRGLARPAGRAHHSTPKT